MPSAAVATSGDVWRTVPIEPPQPESIFFAENSAGIGDDTRAVLKGIAESLRAHPEVIGNIGVEGHADSHETDSSSLATLRAEAALAYFTKEGGMNAAAFVLLPTVVTTSDPARSEQQRWNRRVVLRIVKK
ncbi:MAG: OmpA family protein [Patescibacteria group bacterium]